MIDVNSLELSSIMKSTKDAKKGRGRPATGKGAQTGERWHSAELAAIDVWISVNEKDLSRAHAIRRLVAIGLKAKK